MRAKLLLFFLIGIVSAMGQAINWELVSPYPTALTLTAVTYGDGRFVAVGNSVALYSEDNGVTWKESTGVGNESYVGVAYGNGRFVTVGSGASVATSTDGRTWTRSTPAGNPGATGLAFGNGIFVAPCVGGKVASSTNGVDWAYLTVGTGQLGGWIAYGNGKFLINESLGNTGAILFLSSTDGTTWSEYRPSIPPPFISYWERAIGMVFGDGGFVTVAEKQGLAGDVMFSTDGVTFTDRGGAPGDSLIAVNDEFAVIAQFFSAWWSSDLNGWNAWPPSNGDMLAGAAGGGVDVLVGRFGAMWRGANLASLERLDSDKTTRLAGVAAKGSTVVGIHSLDPATFLVSTNGGQKFVKIPAPETSGMLKAIAQTGGTFVAVGAGGTVIRSMDGLNWSKRLSNTSSDLYDVANGGGLWVAVGANGKIISSPDGALFSLRSSGTEVALNGVTYGNGTFVVVGASGIILSSVNGTDWTMTGTDEAKDLDAVAYGNGRFVATGLNGIVHTWVDGTPRQTTTIAGTAALKVAFQNGRFVALDIGTSRLYASVDGVTWTAASTPYGELFAINASDSRLWVSGYYDPFVAGSLIWEAEDPQLKILGSVMSGKFHGQITVPAPGKYRVYKGSTVTGIIEARDLLDISDAAAEWVDNDPLGSAAFYLVKAEP